MKPGNEGPWQNPNGPTPEVGSWWRNREGRTLRVASIRKRGVMLDMEPKLLPPRFYSWEDFNVDWAPAELGLTMDDVSRLEGLSDYVEGTENQLWMADLAERIERLLAGRTT